MRVHDERIVTSRARVIFRGSVQGVNFRAHCRQKALETGLKGWVRNLTDGSVEAVFEGEREVIEEAIAWNQTRQPHAEVQSLEVTWFPPEGEFRSFEILR